MTIRPWLVAALISYVLMMHVVCIYCILCCKARVEYVAIIP